MSLGKTIKAIRKHHRLNQVEFAERLNTRQGTISDYERDKSSPGYFPLTRLLLLARNDEQKRPLLEAIGDLLGLKKPPTEEDVDHAHDMLSEYIEEITGRPVLPLDDQIKLRFFRAVNTIVDNGVSEDLCRLLEVWVRSSTDPSTQRVFADALAYVQVSIVRSSEDDRERHFADDAIALLKAGDPVVDEVRRAAAVLRKKKKTEKKVAPRRSA